MITIYECGKPVGRVSGAAALNVWLQGRQPGMFAYADQLGQRIDLGDIREALGIGDRRYINEAMPGEHDEIGERKFEALMSDLKRARNGAAGIAGAMDEQRLAEVWDALMSIFEICGGDPDASLT